MRYVAPKISKLTYLDIWVLAGLGGDDLVNGIRVSEVRLYIDRLLVAQKRIDKRIKSLGGKSLVRYVIA